MADAAVFCEDRLDLLVAFTFRTSMNPLQYLVAFLPRDPVGHRPHQGGLEPSAGCRSMIFRADTLHQSLSNLSMRLDVDQEQIRQCGQITDANHYEEATKERAQGHWQFAQRNH